MCSSLVKKRNTCHQLAVLCDIILCDLGYKMTSAPMLLSNALKDERLKDLSFLSEEYLKKKSVIKSCLSESENSELSVFLYSLGKSDVKTQTALVNGFKKYISNAENDYGARLSKNAKLYVALAFFCSTVVSIMVI